MPLYINTNVPALNAQRALLSNNRDLEQTFKRLSTGLRINSAKDDAAGLAISARFTSQIRGLNQAVRNANDGISLAQTAEAAMNEMGEALQRMRELAVQAANDTNSASDRAALQAEVDQHVAEIDRIATQTNFNGRTVLDGSFTNRVFQIGANEGDTLPVSIRSARAFNMGATAKQTFPGADNALAEGDLAINAIDIGASAAEDDQLSSVDKANSAIAKAAAINAKASETGVTAKVEANEYTAGPVSADSGNDGLTAGELTINGISITATTAIQAGDTGNVLRDAINGKSDLTGVTAELVGTDLVLTAADGRNIKIGGSDAANVFGSPTGTLTDTHYAAITLESDDDIETAAGNAGAGTYGNFSGTGPGVYAVDSAVNIETISITDQSSATEAIGVLDTALRQVTGQQADLGAILSRFESTVSSLSAVSENLAAARSRIRDADFAAETALFTKSQILQQSSTSILAQANVAPQIALSLLQ